MDTKRIRWEEDAEADEFIGYIGTLPAYMFLICDDGEPEWLLTSRLPDDEGERCWRAPHPDQLKAEAERWLEEFASSLGAVFGDAAAADFRARADELDATMARDTGHERDKQLFGAGLRRAADLIEHGDQPAVHPEPVPSHPEEETGE